MSEEDDSFFAIEEKEINLLDLLLILKKRQSLIYGTVLLSIILVSIYIFLVSPVYNSTFIIKFPVVTAGEASKILQELGMAIKEESFVKLAEKLDISKEKAEKIDWIGTTTISPFQRIDQRFIEVSLNVKDPEIISELKDKILIFFNKNKYINKRITKEKEQLSRIRNDIQSRIEDIESFRNILANQIKSGNRGDIGFNPMGMERDVIEFKKELSSLEDKIELIKGFELLTEPYIPKKPFKPRKKMYLTMAAFISLILSTMLVLIIDGIRKLRESSR